MLTTKYLNGLIGKGVVIEHGICRNVGRLAAVTELPGRWFIELEGRQKRILLVPTNEVYALLTTEYLNGLIGEGVGVITCNETIFGRLVSVKTHRRWFSNNKWKIEVDGVDRAIYLTPTDYVTIWPKPNQA